MELLSEVLHRRRRRNGRGGGARRGRGHDRRGRDTGWAEVGQKVSGAGGRAERPAHLEVHQRGRVELGLCLGL